MKAHRIKGKSKFIQRDFVDTPETVWIQNYIT